MESPSPPAFLSTGFVGFHTTILPHDGVSRQCRLFIQVAPLVSRHATRQGFPPHRLAKADRHVPNLTLGSHTSDVP